MKFIDVNSLSELEKDWVRRLRFSKCLDTLDRMVELSEARCAGSSESFTTKARIKAAINTAWCVREQELKAVGAPVFKNGKVRMS